MFNIAILNPLRFVDTAAINDSFDGNFAIDQVLSYQNPRCYCQKWQLADTLKLQITSDFEPTDLLFKDLSTDLIIVAVPWEETPTIVVDQTFKVYELEFEFETLPEGRYYTEFSYIDDNDLEHILLSEPLCVSLKQENTLLLEYKNSVNDFDVIFDTGIVFNFRVESAIKDYTPGNSREIYNDQPSNPTLLSAVPYRKFKFYLGYQQGFPAWVMDKVNYIQSVDQVKYNNVYYQIVEGSDYETETNDDNSFTGGSIEVQPTNNNFNRYQTIPSDDENLIYFMGRRLDYFNVSDDFNIPGQFKSASLLEQILVTKRSPAGDLVIKVGLTPGGSEIGEFTVDDVKFIQTCPWLFSATTTVYLSGLAGADVDITFLYLQTDAPPIDLGSLVPAPVINLAKNTMVFYEETMPGELDVDFDVSTGLGRANTKYQGWAICDGRNGTVKWDGRSPIMQDLADPDFAVLKSVYGEKDHALTIPELPAHGHGYEGVTNPSGGGDGGRKSVPNNKTTSLTGGNEAHNTVHPVLVTLLIKKIEE